MGDLAAWGPVLTEGEGPTCVASLQRGLLCCLLCIFSPFSPVTHEFVTRLFLLFFLIFFARVLFAMSSSSVSSKKSARKQREKKNDEAEWRTFIVALEQFKKDGTGSRIEDQLLKEFPLFHGKAPGGHPYPQAFTEGATDNEYCYIERVDDLVLLRRKLPSSRIISIDTCDFAMLNGGTGIAHLNMNIGDKRVEILKSVKEAEARKMLMDFEEISEMRAAPEFFAMYKSLGGSADEVEYRRRLESFFLHTLMSVLGYDAEICGLPPTATQDGKGYRFYASRSEAQRAFMEAEQVEYDEFRRIFDSVDMVHMEHTFHILVKRTG